MGSSTPGTLMPLFSPSGPPSATSVAISPSLTRLTATRCGHRPATVCLPGARPSADRRRLSRLARVALEIADSDGEGTAGRQRHWSAPAQLPGANLRAAEILKQRHDTPRFLRSRAHLLDAGRVRSMRAVREVQPEDVDAGRHQVADDGIAGRCGAERRNDLGSAHADIVAVLCLGSMAATSRFSSSGAFEVPLNPWNDCKAGWRAPCRTPIGVNCPPCARCSKPFRARPRFSARPTGTWKPPISPSHHRTCPLSRAPWPTLADC